MKEFSYFWVKLTPVLFVFLSSSLSIGDYPSQHSHVMKITGKKSSIRRIFGSDAKNGVVDLSADISATDPGKEPEILIGGGPAQSKRSNPDWTEVRIRFLDTKGAISFMQLFQTKSFMLEFNADDLEGTSPIELPGPRGKVTIYRYPFISASKVRLTFENGQTRPLENPLAICEKVLGGR